MSPKVESGRFVRLAAALLAITVMISTPVQAASGMLTSTLGRWLDSTAAPKLGEVLGKHPKFTGETIHLVSMRDGKPVEVASRLHQVVQDHLTQNLLRYPGVRLAWQQPRQQCGRPKDVPYLLGVEIERHNSQTYTLNIAMVDVAESVWVSGVNFSWQGRLTSAEKLALNSAVDLQPRGTVDSPYPSSATADIASQLKRDVLCTLPEGLDGPLFITPADNSTLNRILSQLQKDLTIAAMAAVTRREADAEWRLSLQANPVSSQTQELVLTLTDKDGVATQQVASAFVVGLPTSTPYEYPGEETRIASTSLEMLTPMRLEPASSTGICKTSPWTDHCVEITFELNTNAYLFVLSTRDHQLRTNACSSGLERADAGERRYRLRIPETIGSSTADAGLYAIAVRDRNAARALSRHIRRAPGTCNRNSVDRLDGWLIELDALLAAHPNQFEWRAIHLAARPDGIVSI